MPKDPAGGFICPNCKKEFVSRKRFNTHIDRMKSIEKACKSKLEKMNKYKERTKVSGKLPMYCNEELIRAFKKYKTVRDNKELPYTLESLWVYLKIPKRRFYIYADAKHRPDLVETMDMIYAEICSSLVDNAILEKSQIAKWLITCRDKDTYSETQKVDVDASLNITFKKPQKPEETE